MINTGSDFYPVGYKVRMPSIQPRAGSSSGNVSAPTRPSTRKAIPSVRAHSHNQAGREVNELSKVLTFSDDAVSHISPRLVSYNKAKESSSSLFKPSDLNLGVGSRAKKAKGVVGRHDCRGELKRHIIPCHLQVSEQSPSTQYEANTQVKRNRSFQNDSVHEHVHVHGKDEDILIGRVRSVAPSRSIPWQDDTLTKVSSSTARHLVGLPSSDNFDEDDKRLLSHRRSHNLDTPSALAVAISDELDLKHDPVVFQDELLPAKDFTKELEGGARPIHQLKGGGNTIVLSNTAQFNKVLQPSYPHSPSQWQAEVSKVETYKEEEKEEEDDFVIGYRRWSDFPQRAKVYMTDICRYDVM